MARTLERLRGRVRVAQRAPRSPAGRKRRWRSSSSRRPTPDARARAQYKEEAQQLEQQLIEEKAKNQRQIEEDMAHVKKLWQE